MNAFVTGSQVYGTPSPDSDVDLCVVLSGSDFALLNELCDGDGKSSQSIRFGKLNLIILPNEKAFEAWQVATESLKARKPVARDEAVVAIKTELKARDQKAAA